MEITAEAVSYLKEDLFLPFSNTESFPELSDFNREVLKTYGLPTNPHGTFPKIVSDGKLKKINSRYIGIGRLPYLQDMYCIDLEENQRVVISSDVGELIVVNSSLKTFLLCKYRMAKYYNEVEYKKKYGDYQKNRKKYVQMLKNMLEEVEANIDNYEVWQFELFEKELGVI